ncbi:MAG: crossover junction endodeoxyribonuclease RuvC [Candidatus Magasanikbacteria bacterium]|jgi:crossover junction endodeoxyribonuclease RuvC|nr:crossover junction endodeoxyribonuclease RuvC [Candidatus Magasanikbacteria bacterium]
MRVLGIDPGYGRIGWGIIEGEKATWKHIAHGCIETDASNSFVVRLATLESDLQDVVTKYNPNVAGMETLFFKKNVTTGLDVAHARGVMLLLLHKNGVPVRDIKPVEVKQAVTGHGGAEKTQVQHMVAMLLGLPEKRMQDDAADALAVALATSAYVRKK